MSKHKYTQEQREIQSKQKLSVSKRNINRTFNMIEIILVVSIFNALFYRFGLDVGPAMGVFAILFPMLFVVYIIYKVKNRRKKKYNVSS